MKKVIIVILLISILSACKISFFDRYNYFGISYTLIATNIYFNEQSVLGNERTLHVSEEHHFDNAYTTLVADPYSFSTANLENHSGITDLYMEANTYLPTWKEQSGLNISTLIQLLGILSNQDLNYIGGDSFSGNLNGTDYFLNSSSQYVESMEFPTGQADINGWEEDYFSTSMLQDGIGDLIQIDFDISSENTFLDGNGVLLLSNGFPNGLLYLLYDHSTEYTTVAYQNEGSGSSGLIFSAPYEGRYHWYMIYDGHEF